MYPLFKVFLDILLLRKGPQDIPAATVLLYLGIGLNFSAGAILAATAYGLGTGLLIAATDTALLVGLTYSLLYMNKRLTRFTQTLSALAGTGAMLALVATPFNYWWFAARDAGTAVEIPSLALFGLIIWSLVVMAHILRNALSAPWLLGVVMAMVFYWVALSVQNALFPFGS